MTIATYMSENARQNVIASSRVCVLKSMYSATTVSATVKRIAAIMK